MNKIDFAIIITARNCNPNGDPGNYNIPRHDFDGYGEISDVCIKRKIRDRLQEAGEEILMVDNNKATDGMYSTKERLSQATELKLIKGNADAYRDACCRKWIDVRSFGQVIAHKDVTGFASIPVRGPVSIGIAVSLAPVDIINMTITKSINYDKNEPERDRSTIGNKSIVSKGAYVSYGSIFPQLASLTGFTDEDAEKIKQAIIHLFDNDASEHRPSGSMDCALIWAEHNCKNGVASSAKVHRSFNIRSKDEYPYYEYNITPIQGVKVEVYD